MSKELRDAANQIIILAEQAEQSQDSHEKLQYLNLMRKEIKKIHKSIPKEKIVHISGRQKKQIEEALNIDPTHLEEVLNRKEIKNYYQGNTYAKIANLFFEPISEKIFSSNPKIEENIHNILMSSGLKFLSISYLSMTLFTAFTLLFIGSAIGVVLLQTLGLSYGVLLGVILSLLSLITFIYYPKRRIKKRKKEIEKEYPFLISHLAALSKTGVKGVALFQTILHSHYYKSFSVEARRIVNYATIFGFKFPKALDIVAKTTPSKKAKEILLEMAEKSRKRQSIQSFLNTKARLLLTQYTLKKKSSTHFWNIYHELGSTIRNLRFKLEYLITLIIAIVIISLDFVYVDQSSIGFILLIILAIFIGWSFIIIDSYKKFLLQKKMEAQFYHFINDFKKTKNLLHIRRDYKELQIYVQKLINQYRIGIPLDKALITFARDTDNPMIEAAIFSALEAKRHGSSLPEALQNIVHAKTKRNILKFTKK